MFVLEEYNGSTKPCVLSLLLSQSFSKDIIIFKAENRFDFHFCCEPSLLLGLISESFFGRIIFFKDNFVSFFLLYD